MIIKKKIIKEKAHSQRYVRNDETRINQLKREGWKVFDSDFSDLGLNNASTKRASANGDLVLMVKGE